MYPLRRRADALEAKAVCTREHDGTLERGEAGEAAVVLGRQQHPVQRGAHLVCEALRVRAEPRDQRRGEGLSESILAEGRRELGEGRVLVVLLDDFAEGLLVDLRVAVQRLQIDAQVFNPLERQCASLVAIAHLTVAEAARYTEQHLGIEKDIRLEQARVAAESVFRHVGEVRHALAQRVANERVECVDLRELLQQRGRELAFDSCVQRVHLLCGRASQQLDRGRLL
mmetsp:Transcript_24857/g.62943  ORF Transcript_24857/g.62943 Transcript_24857/m.62943 type:complete len:227 (-) Transcript_24857:195-875(-)